MSRWSDFSVNPWFYLSFFSLKGSFTWLAIGPQILQDLTKCSTTSTGISFYIFAIFFITVNTECFKLALFVGPVFIEPIRTSAEGGKQIVLFPEGTNITPKVRFSKSASLEQSWSVSWKNTEQAKEKSDSFAEGSHRPKYNHVLHPRTTGFVHMVRMRMRMTMTMMTSDRTIFLLYIKYIFDLRPGAWWTGECWDPSWTAPSPTLTGITVSHSCFHFHWSYLVRANVPTSEAAVLSGALPSQVHLHITRWTSDHMITWWSPDDHLMITWRPPEDQLMINWWPPDAQLMITWWSPENQLMIN